MAAALLLGIVCWIFRDSFWDVIQEIKKMNHWLLAVICLCSVGCSSIEGLAFTPVSYTHLDVYKRQTYNYAMSILKSNNGNPDSCSRYTFAYENPAAGEAHFIHTYKCDGNPLPSFEGEPKLVGVLDDIDAYKELLWNSLNEDNKVSLFVRYIDIATGKYETRIVNKNK